MIAFTRNYKMQQVDEKSLYFRKTVGDLLQDIRDEKIKLSCNKFANEYGLNDSNLGKIERALIDCKFVTLWKILEALGIDILEFVTLLKERLGDDFTLIDQ